MWYKGTIIRSSVSRKPSVQPVVHEIESQVSLIITLGYELQNRYHKKGVKSFVELKFPFRNNRSDVTFISIKCGVPRRDLNYPLSMCRWKREAYRGGYKSCTFCVICVLSVGNQTLWQINHTSEYIPDISDDIVKLLAHRRAPRIMDISLFRAKMKRKTLHFRAQLLFQHLCFCEVPVGIKRIRTEG
jgi:hypothetical protein